MGCDTFNTSNHPAYEFTYQHEIGTGANESRIPHWPGGESGVTIGPGFDMRHRTADEIVAALEAAGVDEDTAQDLSDAAGLYHGSNPTAKAWAASHRTLRISDAAQRTLFEKILVPQYEKRARTHIDGRFGPGTWHSLSAEQQEMLFDYEYNVGLTKFPKFTKHVVQCNWKETLVEYKRGGVRRRNADFKKAYLDPRLER